MAEQLSTKKWGKWYIGTSSGYQSSENGFQLTFQYAIWGLCSILWKYRKLHDLTHSLRHLSRANLQPSGLIQIYRLKTGKKLEHCEFHTTSDDTGRDWPGPSFRQKKQKGPEGLVKKQEENCWKSSRWRINHRSCGCWRHKSEWTPKQPNDDNNKDITLEEKCEEIK